MWLQHKSSELAQVSVKSASSPHTSRRSLENAVRERVSIDKDGHIHVEKDVYQVICRGAVRFGVLHISARF